MAREALADYQAAVSGGSEPVYPQWADDMLEVCEQAEVGLKFQLHQTTRPSPLHGGLQN